MSRLKKAGVGITVAGSLAIGLIGGFEGLRTKAYRDVVGVPTVCFGETRGVKMGDAYTVDQCKTMLGDALVEFETGMRRCMVAPDAVPDKPYVAFLSFTYNVGIGAYCKSTLARRVNTGDIRGACNELPKWNRAGGRIIRGLTTRRAEERKLCLEGVLS
ncbi:MAG: lysozyme [Mesorhizobium sp.]|nr:MAG: lysozyme [Mesorhizobium sp.]